jgi:hypothetical protein
MSKITGVEPTRLKYECLGLKSERISRYDGNTAILSTETNTNVTSQSNRTVHLNVRLAKKHLHHRLISCYFCAEYLRFINIRKAATERLSSPVIQGVSGNRACTVMQ